MRLVSTGAKLQTCRFYDIGDYKELSRTTPEYTENEILLLSIELLTRYYSGEKISFGELHKAMDPGGTSFQQRVWKTLQGIPYGETASYREVAFKSGSPKGARAAGQAVGKNPLPVIVPCHRVLGAHSLGGFSAGLDRKRYLLRLEGLHIN